MSHQSVLKNVLKNFSTLTGGSILGQLAMVAVLPILTRFYEPSAFGLLGAYCALVMFLLPAACLRFDIAIPIPQDEEESIALAVLALISMTVVSILYWIALELIERKLESGMRRVVSDYGWLIPLSLWSAALFSISQFWAVRKNRFESLALAHVSRGFSGSGLQLGLGFFGIGPIGLLFGQAVYMGLGSVIIATAFVRDVATKINKLGAYELVNTGKRHWRFPIISAPDSLLDAVAVHFPLLLVVTFYGAEAGGYLFLAQRVTSIPVGVVGGNLSRIFLGEAPNQLRQGKLFGFTVKIMITLFFVSVLPALLVIFNVQDFTQIMFGTQWDTTATFIVFLVPAALLQFCVAPVSTILLVCSRQHLSLIVHINGAFCQLGAMYLLHSIDGSSAILGFAIGSVVHYFIYAAVILFVAKNTKS